MDNMRALLVGGEPADAERLAARLGAAALVICFAPDRTSAEGVKRAISSHAEDARVTVMVGDPSLLVHKVSGPFDLIVLPEDQRGSRAAVRERLRAMLRENGEFDG